jgi:hypothetical protein
MIDLAVYGLVTHMEGVLLKDQQKLWMECKSSYLELKNPEKLRKMQRCYADLQLSMMHYIYTIQKCNSHYRGRRTSGKGQQRGQPPWKITEG